MSRKSHIMLPFFLLAGVAIAYWVIPANPTIIFGFGYQALFEIIFRLFAILIGVLVFTTTVVGVARFSPPSSVARALQPTVFYFALTGFAAIVIGLVVSGTIGSLVGVYDSNTIGSASAYNDFLHELLLEINTFSFYQGNYFFIFLLSLLFAVLLGTAGRRSRTVLDFFTGFRDILLEVYHYVLYLAPVAVGLYIGQGFINWSEAEFDLSIFAAYAAALGIALLLHTLVVLPVIFRVQVGSSPYGFYRNIWPALLTSFAFHDPFVAYPVLYRNVTDSNGADDRSASLVLPPGLALNRNGTAIYCSVILILAVFLSGDKITAAQFLAAVPLMYLASIFIPRHLIGLERFSLFAGTLTIMGAPESAYSILAALAVVDIVTVPFVSAVDVLGTGVGAAVVARGLQKKPTPKEQPPARRERPDISRRPARGKRPQRPEEPSRRRPVRASSGEDRRRPDGRRQDGTRRRPPRPRSGGRPKPERPRPESRPSDERSAAPPDLPDRSPAPQEIASERETDTTRREPVTTPEPEPTAATSPADRPPPEQVETTTGNGSPSPESATTEEDTAPEFGRIKTRRGRVTKNGKEESKSESDSETESEPEYPLTEMDFGRKKKKKPAK